jgi:hypothetical protein
VAKRGNFVVIETGVHGRVQISGIDSCTNIELSLLESLQMAASSEARSSRNIGIRSKLPPKSSARLS